jgi:hypothetical protein
MLPNTLYAPLVTGMLPTATLQFTFPVPVGVALVVLLAALAVSGVILGWANRPIPRPKRRRIRPVRPRMVRPVPNQA